MEQEWKQIKNYEGLYETSNMGQVKRLGRYITRLNGTIRYQKELLFSCKPNKHLGYVNVGLTKDRVKTTYSVHRLVAEHFVDNPHNLNVVNHLDEDRANNKAENLEWTTHAKNLAHNGAFMKGREKIKRKVYQYTLNGELVRTYGYAKEVSKHGFRPNAVTQVCLGYKKTHYGFVWKYD